ncbi:MAG: hypothetical protein HY840_01885 [Bacteroidetes bacterium]|nr:hypothetical protein [Bacteroidota bacterium]
MKKITPEESAQMPIKGTGNSSQFYKAIISLHIGEVLFISKKEFTLSRSPARICRTIMKRFPDVKYRFGEVADGSGWKVERLEVKKP